MLKDEAVYIMQSKLWWFRHNGKIKNKILKSGDFVHFPNKSIHQEEAIEDTYLIECSTILNDRVELIPLKIKKNLVCKQLNLKK